VLVVLAALLLPVHGVVDESCHAVLGQDVKGWDYFPDVF